MEFRPRSGKPDWRKARGVVTLRDLMATGRLMQNFEVELKFSLPPEAAAALEGHPILQNAASTKETPLAATYFDTPAQDLRRALVSCRIRDEAERRLQTLKSATGDATTRHEWETETQRETPDLTDVPLPRALRKAIADAQLEPMFQVNVERHSWLVTQGASLIEAAFDRGWILADGRSAAVCEFELELKQGDARDLFALARRLCEDLPLDFDLRTKSQRGFALKADATDSARAPRAIPTDAPFVEGFVGLAQACLEPLAANVPVLRATQAPEALHQTRTAVRRLRALLRVFKRHIHDEAFDNLDGELQWLSQALGAARDLDVADMRLKLGQALQSRRAACYAHALDALASPRYRLLLVDFAAWLSHGDWRAGAPRKKSHRAFADVATREMRRRDKRICKVARDWRDLDADARHKLRIRAKCLAYVHEMTAGLAARGARKDQAVYLKRLKAFQTALGELNDARISEALLAELAPETGKATQRRATRRNARDADKLESRAHKALSRFLDAPRAFSGD
jgi:inorganic triphosphatase YgiF